VANAGNVQHGRTQHAVSTAEVVDTERDAEEPPFTLSYTASIPATLMNRLNSLKPTQNERLSAWASVVSRNGHETETRRDVCRSRDVKIGLVIH